MKLSHVKIRDVLGIEFLEFEAGKLTNITGDNGAGKSSVLAAIKGALGRGDQAELIRNGAPSAEVVLVFDTGHELTMKTDDKGTRRKIKTPDGISSNASQEWITARLNPLSFNPVVFLQSTNEQRIEQLLKVAKLSMRAVDLHYALAGIENIDFPGIPSDGGAAVGDPLGVIASVSKRIYDHRTGLNRSAKDKRGHIAELEKTLPAGESGPVTDLAGLRGELEVVRKQATTEKNQIQSAAASARNATNIEAANADRAANEEYNARIKAIAARKADALAAINRSEKDDLAALQDRLGPRAEALREEIGRSEAELKEHARSEHTRASIRVQREQAEKLECESQQASDAIDRLDELRESLLSKLPIKSLEIRDGELFYGDVRYSTLNEAARVRVAMELAAASAGELKLICVDGLERLGKRERASVEAWAKRSDAQFFLTRVVDDASLTITTGDGQELEAPTHDMGEVVA